MWIDGGSGYTSYVDPRDVSYEVSPPVHIKMWIEKRIDEMAQYTHTRE